MDKTLFLDFDGVLNDCSLADPVPDWAREKNWRFIWIKRALVANLAPLLDLGDDFKIVIASTWREHWGKPDLARILNDALPGLGDRIVGVTPVLPRNGFESNRGREIAAWLKNNAYTGRFAILDDDGSILPAERKNFVRTHPMIGVTREDVALVQSLLN